MAKTDKTRKLKTPKKPGTTRKQKPLKKPKLKKRKTKPIPSTTRQAETETDSDSDADDLSTLLEPYTKDQLIDLITDFSIKNPSLYSLIEQHADRDVTHRNVFVHGFSWDTTRQDLASAFEPFGEIEECNVVTDKATGKAKGYGFVLFKSRKAAISALKEAKRMVGDRMASCQLASVGSSNAAAAAAAKGKELDGGVRKIYVSNVGVGIDKEKLRDFFEKFGEIEYGPIGFDKETGKSRGYALFVYKTVEGAKKVLEEPHKMFEGQQLRCSVATEGKNKSNQNVALGNQQVGQYQQQQVHQQSQGQVLAAVAAAHNLALFGQHPGLNPLYNALLGNTGVGRGMTSPAMAGAIGQSVATSQVGGLGVGSQSALGAYRAAQGLQHVYPSTTQIGQAGMGRGQGAGGSFAGYPSYMWYGLFKLDFDDAGVGTRKINFKKSFTLGFYEEILARDIMQEGPWA
ncbi:unnamed protein product [Dovyalis caffra]|uniref:RRM domain-containing protein n=1 Tax=Dovyalis caffra TaxID=77055 RepID=A0AAV1RGV3_9ROSI|nr:unnamed protein product [Dovyalis caffra]